MEFSSIFKEVKTERKIFRQSYTKHLQTFSRFSTAFFTRSEAELDYYHQNVNVRVASCAAKRFKKIP